MVFLSQTEIGVLLPCVYACFVSNIMTTTQLIYWIIMIAPTLLNNLFAYVTDGTTIYHVPERDGKKVE